MDTAGSLLGASEAFVVDLKARFQAQFGVEPYVIGHPNFWANYPSTDEVTLMFGPPAHHHRAGRDGAGKETINITPGFWNPTVNPWYLPREGGVHYDAAWAMALSSRAQVDHLYVDSWNETGEGSGLFEALTSTYTSADTGSCSTWSNTHDESWGPSSRHYIETTAVQAAAWNDLPDDDAAIVAHDLPATLVAGERRLVTVLMRNRGDRAWTQGDADGLDVVRGTPWIPNGAGGINDGLDEIPRYGGLFRGRPRAFTFELVGMCETGSHTVELRMARGATGFGDALVHTVTVP